MGSALITGSRNPVDMSVGRFVAELAGLLGALFVDPRRIAAVAEFGDGRYVQFWAEDGTSLVSEVSAILRPKGPLLFSADDELRMGDLGWSHPRAGNGPNWRHEVHDVAGLIACVNMVTVVILEILGEEHGNTVNLRSWVVHRDGLVTTDTTLEPMRIAYQASLDEIRRLLDSD